MAYNPVKNDEFPLIYVELEPNGRSTFGAGVVTTISNFVSLVYVVVVLIVHISVTTTNTSLVCLCRCRRWPIVDKMNGFRQLYCMS